MVGTTIREAIASVVPEVWTEPLYNVPSSG